MDIRKCLVGVKFRFCDIINNYMVIFIVNGNGEVLILGLLLDCIYEIIEI